MTPREGGKDFSRKYLFRYCSPSEDTTYIQRFRTWKNGERYRDCGRGGGGGGGGGGGPGGWPRYIGGLKKKKKRKLRPTVVRWRQTNGMNWDSGENNQSATGRRAEKKKHTTMGARRGKEREGGEKNDGAFVSKTLKKYNTLRGGGEIHLHGSVTPPELQGPYVGSIRGALKRADDGPGVRLIKH